MKSANSNTSEQLITKLCNDIDHLKAQVEYWKTQYKTEVKQRDIDTKKRLKEATADIANMFKLALAMKEAPDGSLIISKEARVNLTKTLVDPSKVITKEPVMIAENKSKPDTPAAPKGRIIKEGGQPIPPARRVRKPYP